MIAHDMLTDQSSSMFILMLDVIDIHVIFIIPPLSYSSFSPPSSSTFQLHGLNRMSSLTLSSLTSRIKLLIFPSYKD
jgi:hypothetical protein